MVLKGKNMKSKAIVKIVIISLVALLAIVFSFLSFGVANKNYKFVGFANALNKSLDYNDGVYAEYRVSRPEEMSDEDYNTKLNDTLTRIQSVLSTKGLNTARLTHSNTTIRIEAPVGSVTSDVLSTIGLGDLKIRTSSDSSKDPIVTSDQITSAFATQIQTSSTAYQWGAYLSFNDDAKAALAEATKSASSSSSVTIYMFRGDSETSFFSLQISEKISQNFMFISSTTMSQSYAEELALQMFSGSLPLTVETIGEVNTISAGAGASALLGLAIAAGVFALILLVFFAVRYREFGLMIDVSLVLFVGLTLFILQAVPVFELSVAGMAGILLSIILFAAAHIFVFEKIKREYASGKKMMASVKTAFAKSNWIISEIFGAMFVLGLLSFLVGSAGLKAFGISVVICSLLIEIITLVITKMLISSYLVFNSTNNKRVNLVREEDIDEIGWFFIR